MFAASFLGTLRHARDRTTGELRKRRYDDADDEAWHVVADALDAVCDLVDLCLLGVPLPTTDGVASRRDDEAIATILDQRFERDPWSDEQAAVTPEDVEADVDLDPTDPSVDRIETVAETVIVPLSTAGPRAANWDVLFDRLVTHAVAVTAECRKLADRQRIDGATDLAAAWEGVAELLGDLASFIAFVRRAAAWTNEPDRETIDRSEAAFTAARTLTDETTTTT
ncbi:hypothetical protein [Halopenitus persicus]|uniref:Uncharacterized protein n=1 Tax=Halopenitus persicus TaxID=1048396 RepID=A0A1H3MCT2_9EURY|nr:hypothetical protein [Halopenitus persicus]SDY74108.1 hypothetical protein SAMN05216564_10934 [Halopenitus persicus]